jgi:hypothetical protein
MLKENKIMRLNPPKMLTFWISIVLGVLGLISIFVPSMATFAPWILLVGFVVLVLGLTVKGM